MNIGELMICSSSRQSMRLCGSERHHSSFLLLPLGAGSSGVTGVLVYVTVLVTTCLTLTGRDAPVAVVRGLV